MDGFAGCARYLTRAVDKRKPAYASKTSISSSWPSVAVKRTFGMLSVRAVRGKCVRPIPHLSSRNFVRRYKVVMARSSQEPPTYGKVRPEQNIVPGSGCRFPRRHFSRQLGE